MPIELFVASAQTGAFVLAARVLPESMARKGVARSTVCRLRPRQIGICPYFAFASSSVSFSRTLTTYGISPAVQWP